VDNPDLSCQQKMLVVIPARSRARPGCCHEYEIISLIYFTGSDIGHAFNWAWYPIDNPCRYFNYEENNVNEQ